MEVNCDLNCVHSKDIKCTLDEITMCWDGCTDFEEIKLPPYTDIFYALICEGGDKENFIWKEAKGKKEQHYGRDMFECNGAYTDARTGVGITEKTLFSTDASKINGMLSRLLELEEERGLSPLYTDNPKFQVIK